jgi:hypothetical protein
VPIIEAAATMTASKDRNLARELEAVHVAVVEDCMKNNITDPAEIRERKMAAHRAFVSDYRKLQNEASAKASAPEKA